MASNRFSLQVDGAPEVAARAQRLSGAVLARMTDAVSAEAKAIFDASQVLVPVDTGALKRTGEVRRANVTPRGEVSIVIRYGGASSPRDVNYAEIVHERLDVHHAPPTQAKYLEQPMLERLPGLVRRLALAGGKVVR